MCECNHSKSKFIKFIECNKRLWLEKYKSEEAEEQGNQHQLIVGNQVGDLAMSLFGKYYLAEVDPINIPVQIENTKKALVRKEHVICEASFSIDGNYCAVDILVRNEDDSFDVFEVKSTTKVKDTYIFDLSYQYYVLKNCGLNIRNLNLVYINNKYVKNGNLDLDKLFIIEDLTFNVKVNINWVESNIKKSNDILSCKEEPNIKLSEACEKYDGCPFKSYCYRMKNIPINNSVMDLYQVKQADKVELVQNGIVSLDQVNTFGLSDIQQRQIIFAKEDRKDTYINKEQLKNIFAKYEYPLYFFDFESFMEAIPVFDNSKPYQQIPFQYSLHILYADGSLEHREFLGDGVNDPRYDLVCHMVKDLGSKGTIIAYNMTFEKTRIKELSVLFPSMANELLNITNRFKDLADIFKKGYCYNQLMGGSFSIKSVLPALFPNDNELNYHNLNQVHKGTEASETFLQLKEMKEKEYNSTRKNLLAYCYLDTYAMVKIYNKLKEMLEL